jgi:hypothetical protein
MSNIPTPNANPKPNDQNQKPADQQHGSTVAPQQQQGDMNTGKPAAPAEGKPADTKR